MANTYYGNISTGRQGTLMLQSETGDTGQFEVMNFSWKENSVAIDPRTMAGKRFHAKLPDGFEGSFEILRQDATAEKMTIEEARRWLKAGVLTIYTLYFYIDEDDGSRTKLVFSGTTLSLDEAGTWAGDKEVTQKFSFKAAALDY